jgi:hypothetical protein
MGIRADSLGNMYIAGYTASLDFPTGNAFQASNASAGDPIPNAEGYKGYSCWRSAIRYGMLPATQPERLVRTGAGRRTWRGSRSP